MISLSLGRRETGKTTLAYHLSFESDTRVIYDPRAMFGTTSDILPDAFELPDLLDTRSEIIVQPENRPKEVFAEVCNDLKAWIKANPEEEVTLLVDEARIIDTPSSIPDSFDYILRMAPRSLVNVIMTAHRPKDISVDIRAIADFWLIFQTTQEHDLGVIAERCGAEVAAAAAKLPLYHVIIWNDAKATYRIFASPEKWYHRIDRLPPQRIGELIHEWA